MVVHGLAQDDVGVGIESLRQLLSVVLQIGLDRVAAALEGLLFSLGLPPESLLELSPVR